MSFQNPYNISNTKFLQTVLLKARVQLFLTGSENATVLRHGEITQKQLRNLALSHIFLLTKRKNKYIWTCQCLIFCKAFIVTFCLKKTCYFCKACHTLQQQQHVYMNSPIAITLCGCAVSACRSLLTTAPPNCLF